MDLIQIRARHWSYAVAVFLVSITFVSSSALAKDIVTYCNGFLAPGTYENVVVPAGAGCFIDGSTIKGDFISSNSGDTISITNTTIRGDLSISGMSPNYYNYIFLLQDKIEGDLNLNDNTPAFFLIASSSLIKGDMSFKDNNLSGGFNIIEGNIVEGDIILEDNISNGVQYVGGNTAAHDFIFRRNVGVPIAFGWSLRESPNPFVTPNVAGREMICQDNAGFTTSGVNYAKKEVIGCN